MAITTAEAFLAVLEKSELLTTEQFAEAQDATLLTSDAAELAELLIRQEMITPWQAGQLLAGRSLLFLGNYALMDLLGRGGMGSVFLAKHRTMNRRVALKVVSKRVGKNPASLERFLAEARSIAALDHPNIIRAYDVDKESDRFYIVMEYIEGRDLDAIVREHSLFGYEEVADCVRQAADGLAHAHGRGMIHCDIKPSNLLLSDQGTIKILDMGMARLAGSDDDSSEQHDREVLGTVDYMSPEQAMEGPDFDHRSDIYSLGCTLYFLLTGRPPFDEGTLTQRIVKHQAQDPPDILEIRPEVPRQLVDICKKMMAKNPTDRYQSADEISQLLAGWREPSRAISATADGGAGKTEPSEKEQAPDSAPQRQPTSLAMEELQNTGGAVAGPMLTNKPKRTWSEEQQTVLLVAAAVLFAIVVLGAALAIMALQAEPANSPDTFIVRSKQLVPPDAPEIPTPDDSKTTPPDAPKIPLSKPSVPRQPIAPKPPWLNLKKADPKNIAPDDTASEPPKVAAAKETEPKPIDPFGDLHPAVDLQLLPATDRHPASKPPPSFMLAAIHPAADSVWKIALVGGDSALPGDGRFVLLPIKGNKGKPTWLVKLERGEEKEGAGAAASEKQPADVARIWYGQGTLVFKWSRDATAETANHLKNCALDITIDGKTRTLALSKPRSVEPLGIDLAGGTAVAALTSEYPPDTSDLRLLVTALECSAPGKRIKQNKVVKASERVDIEVSVGKPNHVVVRISYLIKGGCTGVEADCFYKLGGQNRLVRLKTSEWKKFEQQLLKLLATKQKLEADIAKQKRASTTLSRKQQQLAVIQKRLEELAALLRFKEAVQNNGKVYFREYIETGGRRIELTDTDALPKKKKEGR